MPGDAVSGSLTIPVATRSRSTDLPRHRSTP